MHFFLKSLYIIHIFCKNVPNLAHFCNQNKLQIKCPNRLKWRFRLSSFQNVPGEDALGPLYRARAFGARMFSPPTFNLFLRLWCSEQLAHQYCDIASQYCPQKNTWLGSNSSSVHSTNSMLFSAPVCINLISESVIYLVYN